MGNRIALLCLIVLTAVMAGVLIYGFTLGDSRDFKELLENPWGIVSLFDVYVGFFFFIGWIVYRESCPGIILAWSVAILLGGNLVSGIYAFIALLRSKGDARTFFLGQGQACSGQEEEA